MTRAVGATAVLIGICLAVAMVASCVGDDSGIPAGEDGGPCLPNNSCDEGLSCAVQSGVATCVPSGSTDGSLMDVVTMVDAGGDTSVGADADASQGADAGYSTLTDTTKWSTFDLSMVAGAPAGGFAGSAFDGRYVYFVPSTSGAVTRYDTQATFTVASSWSTFDTTTLNVNALDYVGAAFDGQYVYFVPAGPTNSSGLVVRYNTKLDFGNDAGTSWTTADTTQTVGGGFNGFASAVFDGTYVYLVPFANGGTYDGAIARYNTKAAFDAGASWQGSNPPSFGFFGARGFQGGVFDGRYVYFVPNINSGGFDALVERYDTLSSFGSAFQTFDVTTASDAGVGGFVGGAFDGRYVYFVPNDNGATDGVVAQYDTQADFGNDAGASWHVFDTTTLSAQAKGFMGAAFDGRYVYLVPHVNTAPDGLLARYDTQAPFGTTASWSTFDMATVNASAKGFLGAVFDGRYVYFVPHNSGGVKQGIVARFDAVTPPMAPTTYANGSFF